MGTVCIEIWDLERVITFGPCLLSLSTSGFPWRFESHRMMLILKSEILLSWWSSSSADNNYRYPGAYVSISVAAVAAIDVYIG